MKNTKNRQGGFLGMGAGLVLLALFGGTAAVVAPDMGNTALANQTLSAVPAEATIKEE